MNPFGVTFLPLDEPGTRDLFARVESAAHQAATSPFSRDRPTQKQLDANRYRTGRVDIQGLPIRIETPRGARRIKPGRFDCLMLHHYGDIAGTKGADGDPVDVFIGPFPELPVVYVVNQVGRDGEFDEHKVCLGFATERDARAGYLSCYGPGWDGLGSIVRATVAQLKWWLKFGDKSRPFTSDVLPYEGSTMMDKVLWNAHAEPVAKTWHGLMYELRRDDAEAGLMLDAVSLSELMTDPDIEALPMLDAMVVEVGRLQPKMDALLRIMAASSSTVKPTEVSISQPVRYRGVAQVAVVFTMDDGQTVSVWFHNPDTTPAKLMPLDELISWKWMLNKKDVTIVVAPEKGRDLNPREVARRMMRLVERNSEAFVKANAKTAERAQHLQALDAEISDLEARLEDLGRQIEVAKVEAEAAAPKRKKQEADEARIRAVRSVLAGMPGWEVSDQKNVMYRREDGEAYPIPDVDAALAWFVRRASQRKPVRIEDDLASSAQEMAQKINDALDAEATQPAAVRAWQKAEGKDADPAGGAELIESWDVEKADAMGSGLVSAGSVREFFAQHLAGRTVMTKAGPCYIGGRTGREMANASGRKGGLRLRLAPRVPEILLHGDVLPDEAISDPSNNVKRAGFTAMVPFVHIVNLGDVRVKAEVKAGRRAGEVPLVYSLRGISGLVEEAGNKNADTLRSALEATEGGQATRGKNAGSQIMDSGSEAVNDDGLNLEILQVWDAEGNELDPETGERLALVAVERDLVAAVDAAYRFDDASDDFKRAVAGSIGEENYSPFASAKAIDEAAKKHGAKVAWSIKPVLDSVGGEEGEEVGESNENDEIVFDSAYTGEKKYNPKTDRWVTTETGSRLLLRGGYVIGGAGGKLNGKNRHGVQKSSITSAPARYAKGKAVVRPTTSDGFKSEASHLVEAIGGRYSGREKGYIMAPSKVKLAQHLLDVGATANPVSGAITIGESKDMSPAEAKKHLKSLGYTFDSVEADDDGEMLGIGGLLDAAEAYDSIVVVIKKGAKIVGRAHIAADGKAMVFLGKSGNTRVQLESGMGDGKLIEALWSDDDAGDMVEALFTVPVNGVAKADEPAKLIAYSGVSYAPSKLTETDSAQAWNAALEASAGDMAAAAKAVYKTSLQGTYVETNKGDVLLTGQGWRELKTKLDGDRLRCKTIPYIPHLLKSAQGVDDPLSKPRADYTGFIKFDGVVTVADGTKVHAVAKVGIKPGGQLMYFLRASDNVLDSANDEGVGLPQVKSPLSNPSEGAGFTGTLNENVANEGDDVNLIILEAWDKDGNPLNVRTGEPMPEASPPPSNNMPTQKTTDTALLQGMIDGSVPLLDIELFPKLEPMFERYADDAEMMALLERAANAYGDAAVAAARKALGWGPAEPQG